MGGWAVRFVLVLVSTLAMATTVASPAGAAVSPVTRPDPAGDTVFFLSRNPVNRPKSDIVSITVEHKVSKVVLRLTTRSGTNPATSPLWAPGSFSEATWSLETTGDATEEFLVSLGNRLAPSVFSITAGPVTCPGATSSFRAPATYRVAVPKSCVGNPTRVRASVGFVLGADVQTAVSDRAPVATFTPFVRP